MREFKFLSYHTVYSAEGEGFKQYMRTSACFSDIFRKLGSNKNLTLEYTIKLYRGTRLSLEGSRNNSCLLSKAELRRHLNQMRDIIPFDYTIEDDTEDFNCKPVNLFVLKVIVREGNACQHKFLLAWIRYAYEYPFNVMLYEARRLKKQKEFRFMSGFNLFNIVGQSCNLWEKLHSIAYGSRVKLITKKELLSRLDRNISRINHVFDCIDEDGEPILVQYQDGDYNVHDLEFWTDEKLFQKRIPKYLKRYKELKQK